VKVEIICALVEFKSYIISTKKVYQFAILFYFRLKGKSFIEVKAVLSIQRKIFVSL